jgi:hypothetical protein
VCVYVIVALPDVKVMPHIVWEKPGEEVTMECRVMGEPFPVVQWLKNDDPLPIDMSHKYSLTGDGIRLTLKDVYFSDTGAYMCKAQNSAGRKLDISSLVVIDQQTPSTGTDYMMVWRDSRRSRRDTWHDNLLSYI